MKELEEKIRFGGDGRRTGVVSAWLFVEFTEGLNPKVFVATAFFFHQTNLAAFNSFCDSDKEAHCRAFLC